LQSSIKGCLILRHNFLLRLGRTHNTTHALPPRPGAINFVINDHCMGLAPLQAADEGCETEAC
jgi:hypothetical protein